MNNMLSRGVSNQFTYRNEINTVCHNKIYSFFTANWDYVIAMDLLREGSEEAPTYEKGDIYTKFVKNKKRKTEQNETSQS